RVAPRVTGAHHGQRWSARHQGHQPVRLHRGTQQEARMTHPGHELTLGGLDLIGRLPQGDDWHLEVTGDDATWGNPQSVTTAIKGLLQDGARVALDSWDN